MPYLIHTSTLMAMRVGINQLVVLATITNQSTSLLEKMQSFIVVPWLRIDWHTVKSLGRLEHGTKKMGVRI